MCYHSDYDYILCGKNSRLLAGCAAASIKVWSYRGSLQAGCPHCTTLLRKQAHGRNTHLILVGYLQEKLRKLKSAQILRSLAQKTSFGCAAVEVVGRQMFDYSTC